MVMLDPDPRVKKLRGPGSVAIIEPIANYVHDRVTVGEFVATGCGQSKKKAKHSAAKETNISRPV